MKKHMLNERVKMVMLPICLLLTTGFLQAQVPITDEEAIKAAIIAQTTAWANRDTMAHYNSFVDNALTQTIFNYSDGSIGVFKGMDGIKERVRANIKANPNKTYNAEIKRTNWLIKLLSHDWAWVNFDQKTSNVKGEIFSSYETRLMNKVASEWKIAVINAVWDYKNVEKLANPNKLKAAETDRIDDKAAIMATIQNETDCFYARNYACWKDNYVHGNHVFQGWSNDNGTFDTKVGWEKVNAKIEKYIKENKAPVAANRKVERRNMQYTFYGDMACYMTWDQYQEEKTGKKYMHSHEIRLMEKHDGKWKIACVAAFWDYKNLTPIADLKP